jgi:hypothetical protein
MIIFDGALRQEETGEWRKFLNGDIISVVKSRMMSWTDLVTCMGDIRTAYKILFGELEGKRPLK